MSDANPFDQFDAQAHASISQVEAAASNLANKGAPPQPPAAAPAAAQPPPTASQGGNPFDQFDAAPAQKPLSPNWSFSPPAPSSGPATPTPAPDTDSGGTSQSMGFAQGFMRPFANLDRGVGALMKRIGVDDGSDQRYANFQNAMDPDISKRKPNKINELMGWQDKQPGDVGRVAGEIAGTVPVALATENPWAVGAATGALTTDANTVGGAAADTAESAIGGKVMHGLLGWLTKTPQVAADVKKLLAEDVTPTLGQILGGGAKTAENAATSLPLARDAIIGAKQRALQSFNRAAVNRVLGPIGQTLPKTIAAGHDAVGYAADQLDHAYDTILPHLTASADAPFLQNVSAAATKATNALGQDKAGQFSRILGDALDPIVPAGTKPGTIPAGVSVAGDTLKEIDSKLGFLGRRFSSSQDPDHQTMGEGFQAARDEIRQLMIRNNPDAAAQLKAIDTGYAHLVRVEKAAATNGAQNGVFTPSQLQSAIKATDSSVRKRAVARGSALMQDLATAGRNVIGDTIPDSGTALREIVTSPLKTVATLPASMAARALYSRPGQAIARGIATAARPRILNQIGPGIAPAAAPLGALTATALGPTIGN